MNPQLGHEIGSMDLDGTGANTQIIRDCFIRQSASQTIKHVLFTGCQGGELDLGIERPSVMFFRIINLIERDSDRPVTMITGILTPATPSSLAPEAHPSLACEH